MTNPNRQRLMSPLEYLGAMAGYSPPDPMQQQQQMMAPFYEPQFTVNPYQQQQAPPPQPQPQRIPAIPLSALQGR